MSLRRAILAAALLTAALAPAAHAAAPAVTILDAPPAPVDDTRVTVHFTADAGATTTCAIDGDTPQPCTSPYTTRDAANGSHGLRVIATAAGGTREADAAYALSATPPDTSIDAGPDGSTRNTTPSFGFSSPRARATFACSLDGAAYAPCGESFTTPQLASGHHTLAVKAIDAGGQEDPTPAQRGFDVVSCETKVTFGVIDARASCFAHIGTAYVSDGPVRLNGITIAPISGGQISIDPTTQEISMQHIQLRVGDIVLFEGKFTYKVPAGDRVLLAKISLDSHQLEEGGQDDDSEAGTDLQGDDGGEVGGLDLKGEVKLELVAGATLLTGTIELPKVFTDAEGNGLTGTVTIKADNDNGVQLDGVKVTAPLAFVGSLELHNLFVSFSGAHNGDASSTCNAASPGMRWDGGADAVVLPTPDKLTLNDVGVGFADGALSYAKGTLTFAAPGKSIGAGFRVQKIGLQFCAGPPLHLEGHIGLTGLPDAKGKPALLVPDAGFSFTAGDPWKLSVKAPLITLHEDRDYKITGVHLDYDSSGTVGFGGALAFSIPVKGPVGSLGDLDAAVDVSATLDGFIQSDRYNADLTAKGCFGGTFKVGGTVPVNFSAVCPTVTGVVSSDGLAFCGSLNVGGHDLGSIGAGEHWGGDLKFMAGTCDVGPYRVTRAATTASAARASSVAATATAARAFTLPAGQRGFLVAVRGTDGAPVVVLHGPHGAVVRGPRDVDQAVRTNRAFAFANRAMRTTYVVLATPAGGSWRVDTPDSVAQVSTAPLLAPPAVRATVVAGRGRARTLHYAVSPRPGQRVVFLERGHGVSHVVASVRAGRGSVRFRTAAADARKRRIVALVERDGLPQARLQLARFTAPRRARPGRPGGLELSRGRGGIVARWLGAQGADRYGVRVALSDGRRLFFLRPASNRVLTLTGVPARVRATVRVVGLRADNAPGPAVQSTVNPK